jgi:deoxyribonucleoside regulator
MGNESLNDINAMIRIARKYYELHMSQEEISIEEDTSKSTVSRILHKAEKLGYVRHEIVYPIKSVAVLERQFKEYFNIDDVFIVPKVVNNKEILLKDTCRVLAQDLNRYMSDEDIISVSWGRTIEMLSTLLVPPVPPKKGIKIVQLNGSIATNMLSTKTASILERFTEVYSGVGYLFAAPALVDDKEIAIAIKRDSRIRNVLDLVRAANIAIFSIGQLTEQSVLIERGAITNDDLDNLTRIGAVGDICSRFFDINGKLVDTEYDARTIGIELHELKQKKHRIGIGVGVEKVNSIIGALVGGYLTSLYIDEITALCVINRCEELGFQTLNNIKGL